MNTFYGRMGKPHLVPTDVSDWHYNNVDDLAVCQLDDQDLLKHAVRYFMSLPDGVLTPQLMIEHNIGIGSDVMNVGRFFMYDGKQGNAPLARFASIAQVGVQVNYPKDRPEDKEPPLPPQESFIIDGRSIMGLSGSPIYYVVLTPDETKTLFLLGIVWGHSYVPEELYRTNGLKTGTQIHMNTGLLHALPAWKLLKLLNAEELKMKRKEIEQLA